MRQLLLIFALFLFCAQAQAARPDEMLANPVLEERARVISKDLKKGTFALWAGPVLILLLALIVAWSSFKSKLDAEEREEE